MTRIAYFDPYSGASGDMVLGALLDCGLALDDLRAGLAGLGLAGWSLEAERVSQHGVGGTRARVVLAGEQIERNWAAIRGLLTGAALPEPARAAALASFSALAEAEAQVHDVSVEDVQFHEVGSVDVIVDIVGAVLGLQLLGVERVYSGAPALGHGFAQTRHGVIPVPAPATAQLLANAQAPSRAAEAAVDAELLTPTGAAILTTLAEFTRPTFSASAVGYASGSVNCPGLTRCASGSAKLTTSSRRLRQPRPQPRRKCCSKPTSTI